MATCSSPRATSLHARRAARGDCDYRRACGPASARGAVRSRRRPPHDLQQSIKQLALACHNFQDTGGVLPPWAEGTVAEYGSSHFLLLPFLEQQNIYQQAAGNSFNVRTSPVKLFTCPDDATVKAGVFGPSSAAYQVNNSTAIARTSVNGIPYGAATYAINGQVATAEQMDGHPVKGSTTLEKIKDGTSNTVLFGERMAFCARTQLPQWLDRSPGRRFLHLEHLGSRRSQHSECRLGRRGRCCASRRRRSIQIIQAATPGGTVRLSTCHTRAPATPTAVPARAAIPTSGRTGTAASSIRAAFNPMPSRFAATIAACKPCTLAS